MSSEVKSEKNLGKISLRVLIFFEEWIIFEISCSVVGWGKENEVDVVARENFWRMSNFRNFCSRIRKGKWGRCGRKRVVQGQSYSMYLWRKFVEVWRVFRKNRKRWSRMKYLREIYMFFICISCIYILKRIYIFFFSLSHFLLSFRFVVL